LWDKKIKRKRKMNKAMLCIGMMAAALAMPAVFADAVSVTTTVSSEMSAVFSYSTVAYNALSANTTDNAAPDQLSGNYSVAVTTNKNYNVAALGANFTAAGGKSFAIANLKMDENAVAASLLVGEATTLTEGSQNIASNVVYTQTASYHGYWLSIPLGQAAAAYTGNITVTYSNV
jgi:hypothetical protein